MDNPDLQNALNILDARAELLQSYRENVLHVEQLYNRAKIENSDIEDLQSLLSLCRHHQFRYLAEKFDFLWFDTEKTELAFRHLRPEWDFFTPADFEVLVRCLLYLVENKEYALTQGSHDEGIDLCHNQVFNSNGTIGVIRTVVQCKLYKGTVPVAEVRDFFGVMTTQIAEGYFFTTGHLTNAGIQFIAKANESSYANRFRFIGKEQFGELLKIGHRILQSWEEFYNLDVNESDYEWTSESIFDQVTEAQLQADKIIQKPVFSKVQPSLF